MYIPHARVNSECMFVSVDSVVLCNWLAASKTILFSASIKQHGHIVTATCIGMKMQERRYKHIHSSTMCTSRTEH